MTFDVIIRKSEAHPIKAYADVVLDNSYCLTGVKIVEGPNGVFVSMPQKRHNGIFKDIFFPIHHEARLKLIEAVLDTYQKTLS